MECPRPRDVVAALAASGGEADEILIAAIADCERRPAVDWQAECRALSGSRRRTGDQAIDELVGNFEPEDLASMFLETQRKHDAVRARIDEHADEIVRLRAQVAALTPDPEVLAAAGEVLRLAEGATEGPWKVETSGYGEEVWYGGDGNPLHSVGPACVGAGTNCDATPANHALAERDAAFIAAVRTLAPRLAAWVAERGRK